MGQYFDVDKKDNLSLITFLIEELSIDSADEIKNDMNILLSDQTKNFVIDMSKCVFLPSIALGLVISFNKNVKAKAGKVVICSLNEQVQTLFKITRLDEIFEIYPDQEQAIASFQ